MQKRKASVHISRLEDLDLDVPMEPKLLPPISPEKKRWQPPRMQMYQTWKRLKDGAARKAANEIDYQERVDRWKTRKAEAARAIRKRLRKAGGILECHLKGILLRRSVKK